MTDDRSERITDEVQAGTKLPPVQVFRGLSQMTWIARNDIPLAAVLQELVFETGQRQHIISLASGPLDWTIGYHPAVERFEAVDASSEVIGFLKSLRRGEKIPRLELENFCRNKPEERNIDLSDKWHLLTALKRLETANPLYAGGRWIGWEKDDESDNFFFSMPDALSSRLIYRQADAHKFLCNCKKGELGHKLIHIGNLFTFLLGQGYGPDDIDIFLSSLFRATDPFPLVHIQTTITHFYDQGKQAKNNNLPWPHFFDQLTTNNLYPTTIVCTDAIQLGASWRGGYNVTIGVTPRFNLPVWLVKMKKRWPFSPWQIQYFSVDSWEKWRKDTEGHILLAGIGDLIGNWQMVLVSIADFTRMLADKDFNKRLTCGTNFHDGLSLYNPLFVAGD